MFCLPFVSAQTTEGKEFWLTYGSVFDIPPSSSGIVMQIRIATRNLPASGTIYFTNLNDTVVFSIGAHKIFTHILNISQRQAVYNTTTGTTDYSIHISSSVPVSVYAFINLGGSEEATNVLPVAALGTEYYHCSYTHHTYWNFLDAYAVVATKNNTCVYHNGDSVTTLNTGQVYYRTSTDMTGDLITADHPVAFFALHRGAGIPLFNDFGRCHLIQQLAPVNTWDNTFFVPVTVMESEIVRIVVSQDSTNITQVVGGSIRTGVPGAQTTLDNLMAGEFVELDIGFNGCFIKANKPVGVCSYIKNFVHPPSPPNFSSSAAQTWIPGIRQTVSNALIAPFISTSYPILIPLHQALIITPTTTRDNTKVSIGGMPPTDVTDGTWIENTTAQMSFYSMPLTNDTASYLFSNQKGMFVFVYGIGTNNTLRSYYYLAGSAMHDLDAAFYANDIHFQDLEDTTFCASNVDFRAEIENIGVEMDSIKWYINGLEEISERNKLEWNKIFSAGEYEITMWVRYENNDTISKTGILKIKSCEVNAEFYANNVPYSSLQDTIFCAKDVHFRAEIEGLAEEIKWYFDSVEYELAQDLLEWSKSFETGTYNIEMWVRYANGETATIQGTLKMEVFWVKIRNVRY